MTCKLHVLRKPGLSRAEADLGSSAIAFSLWFLVQKGWGSAQSGLESLQSLPFLTAPVHRPPLRPSR